MNLRVILGLSFVFAQLLGFIGDLGLTRFNLYDRTCYAICLIYIKGILSLKLIFFAYIKKI